MRIVTKNYEVYKFNELNAEAKRKAIEDRINLWIETINIDEISKDSNLYKAYEESERMRTPWFIGSYIYEYCKEELEEELTDYEFLTDGQIFY